MTVMPSMSLKTCSMEVTKEEYEEGILKLGKLVFDFAKVHRAVYHDDGITPESDTDHTVMVGIIACSLAEALYKELDLGKVARYALVHDIVEVYAGDTSTFNISDARVKEKEHREKRALHLIEDQFSSVYPWLPKEIDRYEAKEDKEARFVKAVDKLMTHITHRLNNDAYFKKTRTSKEDAMQHFKQKFAMLEGSYGKEFPALLVFVKDFMDATLTNTYD